MLRSSDANQHRRYTTPIDSHRNRHVLLKHRQPYAVGDDLLLPGTNYSMELMETLEGYKERWVDGRAATLYGETIAALSKAGGLSEADRVQLKSLKQNNDDGVVDLIIDIAVAAKKGTRFARAAAPLILADGPLPFGDVVFALALGLDFAIAAYNLVNDDD